VHAIKSIDKEESLQEMLFDELDRFCIFGQQQRLDGYPLINDVRLRHRLETAIECANLMLIVPKEHRQKLLNVDYPAIHLMSEKSDVPHLLECSTYYLDANILVLNASEDGGKYAIMEHYSPKRAGSDGHSLLEYFW
jgi:hypothetical protein